MNHQSTGHSQNSKEGIRLKNEIRIHVLNLFVKEVVHNFMNLPSHSQPEIKSLFEKISKTKEINPKNIPSKNIPSAITPIVKS